MLENMVKQIIVNLTGPLGTRPPTFTIGTDIKLHYGL